MVKAWRLDEFVLDPCRVTVFIGATGSTVNVQAARYLTRRYDQAGA
jgi:hypothetical protein